jgi:hypothetical protein
MAQEQPVAVNAAIARWLGAQFSEHWRVEQLRPVAAGERA